MTFRRKAFPRDDTLLEPITEGAVAAHQRHLRRVGATGASQKEARGLVLTALVGAPITQGRDLYSADAVLVLTTSPAR